FWFRLTIGLSAATWLGFVLWPTGIVGLGWIGALALAVMGFVAVRSRGRRSRFLAAWWLLEVLGYFVLSPWPAVRRVIGLSVVGALLLARDAGPAARHRVRFAALWSVAFALLFQVIDTSDGVAERRAVEGVAGILRMQNLHAPVWYTGHLGMQFY